MTDTAATPPETPATKSKVVAANAPGQTPPKAGPGKRGPGRNKPGPKGAAPNVVVRPVANPARRQKRHWGLLVTFLLLVAAPIGVTIWYLNTNAADQYGSTLGFTVRSEDSSSAADVLTGFGNAFGVGSGGGSDSDILYEFIRSQELVRTIDQELDLRSLYSRHTDTDPVFGFHSDGHILGYEFEGTIEDLTDYWQRMVRISYDQNSGLMKVTALAFTPEEAQSIASAIYDTSVERINALSADARADATRYARADLDLAQERLISAREALTAFRLENEIVDVTADIQGQMGLLNALQAQLAEALIEFDLLTGNAREGDPRLVQAAATISAIEARIEDERQKFGAGGQGDGEQSYATTVAEFERLSVEREIAEQAYVAAVALYDSAVAEANRQSRYLAAFIQPTLAEKSQYPQFGLIVGLVSLFSFLTWSILALVYYSLRDRR